MRESDGDTHKLADEQLERHTYSTYPKRKKRKNVYHWALPKRAQNISSRSRVSSFHVRSSHVASPTYGVPSGAYTGSAVTGDLPVSNLPIDEVKSDRTRRSADRAGGWGWRGRGSGG